MTQAFASGDPLAAFLPATSAWFHGTFGEPTPAQAQAWSAIAAGRHALVIAPTGSGKTLAAFLWAIDRLMRQSSKSMPSGETAPGSAPHGVRVLYVSPLKALGEDVRRNLREPIEGIRAEQRRRGQPAASVTVGIRTGDTPAADRAKLARHPPDVLITTPESLYLMLTSKAREGLRTVQTVIVDEVHAVVGSKRGAHLTLSLERLDTLLRRPAQRIGLSATVRPVDEVARFLAGDRPVDVVAPPAGRTLDVRIDVPVDDLADIQATPPGDAVDAERGGIWPAIEASILRRVRAARSTIVFVNSRGLAERLTARLNERYERELGEDARAASASDAPGPASSAYDSSSGSTQSRAQTTGEAIAMAHHGSVSKERRAHIEQALKQGELRCVVATSSLELGIDMGDVDLVIQVAAPPSVASALQRIGRASHHVGGVSHGVIYPRTRRDLLDSAAAVSGVLHGDIEALHIVERPLDVLAQQTVAAAAMDDLHVDEWFDLVRRAAPFQRLPRRAFDSVLAMLSGAYSAAEFAELRPRLVWDQQDGTLRARPGAQLLAVTSGGTIPDRGAFAVMLAADASVEQSDAAGPASRGGRRVGELDEEMVYESRVGDVIALGASTWRIESITNDRVDVVPAPGRSARLPFWHGDSVGRPAEFGAALGALTRAAAARIDDERFAVTGLDERGTRNLRALLADQLAVTGAVPSDRLFVVERCRDEVGDWRIILHSPYGRRVHEPWALAIADRAGSAVDVMADDDGIVVRALDSDGRPPGAELFRIDPDEAEQAVRSAIASTSLFAARFRECAARALLLPRRRPGKRSPLWQQRQRGAQLLASALRHPGFPLLSEAARECLHDVFDLPGLRHVLEKVISGEIRIHECVTEIPSPFAASLLFGYVGAHMYQGDVPVAERRAAALSIDAGLLADLLGRGQVRDVLDPAVAAQVEAELQWLAADRLARADEEGAIDLLRELGPLSTEEVTARMRWRGADDAPASDGRAHDARADDARPVGAAARRVGVWLEELASEGRVVRVPIAGHERWAAAEDAELLADGLGVQVPPTVAAAASATPPAGDPLHLLLLRFARTHAAVSASAVAARFGVGPAVARRALDDLAADGDVIRGDFGAALAATSGSEHVQWVERGVFERLKARSLARARSNVRPVPAEAFVRFELDWQGVAVGQGRRPSGSDGVLDALTQLQGLALPASDWERFVLPARVADYEPDMLDRLTAAGEVCWRGVARLGDADGLVAFEVADDPLPAWRNAGAADGASSSGETQHRLEQAIIDALDGRGALFAREIEQFVAQRHGATAGSGGAAPRPDGDDLAAAMWALVWQGRLTNDTLAPVRALEHRAGPSSRQVRAAARRLRSRRGVAGFRGSWDRSRPGIAAMSGRWSLVSDGAAASEAGGETQRALRIAEALLDRYGVVTRGEVMQEGVPGGFSAVATVLRTAEESGHVLRGQFVAGLGPTQFAARETVDWLRQDAQASGPDAAEPRRGVVVLSAVDPANPFGAVLPWPQPMEPDGPHPARRSGALVGIVDGAAVCYVDRGSRGITVFTGEPAAYEAVAGQLVIVLRRAGIAPTVERVNGRPAAATPFGQALRAAGFEPVPKGLRLYTSRP